jgi:CMP-2-keto-3-deoxyoctulosonic acid synthetase
MENRWKIRVAEVEHDAVSVDVPEDVTKVEGLLRASLGMTA